MDKDLLVAHYGLLIHRNFIDDAVCNSIIEQTRCNSSTRATVYGRADGDMVDERVRKASRITPTTNDINHVTRRLLDYKGTIERHFNSALRDCEAPQFLRYEVGDFFVAHQDGNTGLIRLASDKERRISIVIFVNNQTEEPIANTFSGGSLRFSDYRANPQLRQFDLAAETGMLVAFRSEITHEVTPVTHGERYSIVSWYR